MTRYRLAGGPGLTGYLLFPIALQAAETPRNVELANQVGFIAESKTTVAESVCGLAPEVQIRVVTGFLQSIN